MGLSFEANWSPRKVELVKEAKIQEEIRKKKLWNSGLKRREGVMN